MIRTRFPDWEQRFYSQIENWRGQPFQWGRHDCATCAADLIQAMTGEDIMAEFRGLYSSQKDALKTIKQAGYASLDELVTSKLQALDSLHQAQRGDVLLCQTDGPPFLAVKAGSVAIAPGKTGPEHIHMAHWVKAWRV